MERFRGTQAKEQVIAQFIGNCPFSHKDLGLIVVPGSQNNQTLGNLSDLDITTVMTPENPNIVDIATILDLSTQVREWADAVNELICVTPIIVATIRLEEAQIQMGKSQVKGKDILPIHWLFHPSIQFLAANEPPALARGILTGRTIKGNAESALQALRDTPTESTRLLAGLDWLTDGLRILLANCSLEGKSARQPAEFLIQNASHNLHWFWKWNILVPLARKVSNNDQIGWPESLEVIKQSNPEIAMIFSEVHKTRHEGGGAKVKNIVKLHATTFTLWPTLQS